MAGLCQLIRTCVTGLFNCGVDVQDWARAWALGPSPHIGSQSPGSSSMPNIYHTVKQTCKCHENELSYMISLYN
uniref:Uncharacterized protein n=1 Tax=Chelydra serpentina TaxID=8475 RepID=A0A8C3XQ55_CHESE